MTPLQLHRLAGGAVFLITLGLYTQTMAPSTSFWDTGEFITCSHVLGIPHPPGSPLYVLLGRVFSLFPAGTVANRVVFMSVLASAAAVWFTYQSAVALCRRAMGGEALRFFGDARDWTATLGSTVAALCLATSYTFWFNGTEAEVYAYSLFFVCGGLWLILYWEGTRHGAGNDRWLFFIAYFFGLGGGLHLLCLLTIPSLVLLAWFGDQQLRRSILILLVAGLAAAVSMSAFAPYPPSARLLGVLAGLAAVALCLYVGSTHPEYRNSLAVTVGIGAAVVVAKALDSAPLLALVLLAGGIGLVVHLYREDRRALGLMVGVGVLFLLGYSTYLALFLRSGLDPAIDMNDPENLGNFLSFLRREQYGTESQLLGMLTPRADRVYQLWHQQFKYFLQQWPFPFLERDMVFRWATERTPHVISVSAVPLLAGLLGLGWQLRRDWRRFLALFLMFLVMGFGLSFYLNMPDPQPRERHYVFGGMFLAWAVWMGLGWTAVLEALRRRLSLRTGWVAAVSCIGLLLPAGVGAKLHHIEDRRGDYIAWDYAHNLLQSCDPNSLLFTNGDNDTFPLWYLQHVEGIRRDVSIINLSLLNTGWYIKQLRDRDPRVAMSRDGGAPLGDVFIDSTLTDTQMVDLEKRLWLTPKRPREFKDLGLDVEVSAPPGHNLLRVQDIMVIGIVYWNDFRRPVHFAITVAGSNRVGLDPYLEMEGMTLKLKREKVRGGGNAEALARNLMEVYRFRGIRDESIYKDENTSRLLQNYRACVLTLADIYQTEGRVDEMATLLRWAEENVPMGWEGLYAASENYRQAGRFDLAAEFVEKAAHGLVERYGADHSATYDNALALASILYNDYGALDRAEEVYRRTIALRPRGYAAYHELAATLQAGGRTREALGVIEGYVEEYGELDSASLDREILIKALERLETADAETSATGSGAPAE